ncbi:MAG: DUF29 family protein, partial [Coleofasciculus sp. Co-bin14]|nr:DUF29 family protein [Coleofasciculus sp. Co-bin14]
MPPSQVDRQTLYEGDYLRWIETTVERLRSQDYADVDWENLIEEIEDIGRSERRSLESHLIIVLEEFLKLSETKPASEYINGEIIQKPIPKGKHSRLQLRLCDAINDVAEPLHIASAFPELRCSFGIRSIVPDVAVFKWSRIPFDADG